MQQRLHSEQKNGGYTLIELLFVIGILGFLFAALLIIIDPVKYFQDSRDAKRFADSRALMNAILVKQVDDRAVYNGAPSAPIITSDATFQVIVADDTGIDCTAEKTRPGCGRPLDTSGPKTCVTNLIDVTAVPLVTNYISALPHDPRGNGGVPPCGTGSTCATRGNLPIGKTNTGYYIHRTTGDHIEIGACKGERINPLMVKR